MRASELQTNGWLVHDDRVEQRCDADGGGCDLERSGLRQRAAAGLGDAREDDHGRSGAGGSEPVHDQLPDRCDELGRRAGWVSTG